MIFPPHQVVPAGSVPSQDGGGSSPAESGGESGPEAKSYRSKEQLMLRANSLKKALRQIIEQAEKGEGESSLPHGPVGPHQSLSLFVTRRSHFLSNHPSASVVSFAFSAAVVDEQNRHTQVQRMSSSSSIKRESSEDLKDAEPRKSPWQGQG